MRQLITFACLAVLPITVLAQQSESERRVIEEVLVTAERREASAQETAIAISALSGDELELRGIVTVEDLQFAVPNLVISHNSQSPVTYAYIRGIGSDQLVAGFDPGVAYHVDGLYIGQPSSMPGDMWDMERVEVLRGPQGTLYGRNTTGGAINVITRDPSEELEAIADVTIGDYDRRRFRGVVGGGGEGVAVRLAFVSDVDDGYQDNLVGRNGDVTDHQALRGKVAIDVGDRGTIVLTGQRFENNGRQSQRRREPFGPVELAPGFVLNVYEGAIPNPRDPRKVAKDYPEKLDLTNDLLSARITWDFDNFTLVSITGQIENEWFQSSDIDMSNNPVQFQEWDMETKQFTQEFQLVSNHSGPWEWIVGLFWFDEELSTRYLFEDSSIAGFTFRNGGELDTKSRAAFGQVSYDMRDGGRPLRLTAGLRYTEDEKRIDEFQIIPQFGVDAAARANKTWREPSGKLGIDWFMNDSTMAYASYSHGYKGGGYSIGQFDRFEPETVDTVEIGLKSTFLDQRAQVNVSAFWNDYQDLQVNFLLFTSFTTDNAAEATIKGIEIEGLLLATERLTLSGNLAWLDAKFDEYQFSDTISLDGDRMNRAPEYSLGLSAQYDFPLGAAGTLSARADYYWQDEVYYRVQNLPRHRADSYHTADARLIWTALDESWVLEAFVRNLTDEDNLRSITVSDGLSTGNSTFESYFPPRTWGARVGWRFGG